MDGAINTVLVTRSQEIEQRKKDFRNWLFATRNKYLFIEEAESEVEKAVEKIN